MPHVIRTAFVALALWGIADAATAASRIYKTVDKDGNVVFTDVPVEGKEIAVTPPNTFPSTPPVQPAPAGGDAATDADDFSGYERLAIVAPAHDLSVRDNAGNVSVGLAIDPPVDASQGHTLRLLMDGVVQPGGSATNYALTNVDRGTHRLVAQVVDTRGKVVAASEPVTFHMLRASVLTKPRKPPPPPPN